MLPKGTDPKPKAPPDTLYLDMYKAQLEALAKDGTVKLESIRLICPCCGNEREMVPVVDFKA
jgi:hypothetical protein